jgi:hypothetical protein
MTGASWSGLLKPDRHLSDIWYNNYMDTNHGKNTRKRKMNRDRLVRQMNVAKDSGNRREMDDALAEAKRWLRNNYAGDNPVREAQSQLLRAFPTAH